MTSSSSSDTVAEQVAALDSRPVVLDYGDPAAEYAALRTGALLVDHVDRDLWIFQGAQARETLAGLVTNDTVALTPGHGQYAAALTPKGRIVGDMRILALADAALAPAPTRPPRASVALAAAEEEGAWSPNAALLVDVPARAADGWAGVVRKYVNPRLASYRRLDTQVRAFGVYGTRARDAIAEAFGLAPSALVALAPYSHATVETRDGQLVVARVPDLLLDGFVVYVPAAAHDAAWSRVSHVPSVVPGGQRAYEVARIEVGRPAWGVDMDESTIPQEANLDDIHAISYTKGCYTGQEVVARVHFRGHVNRHLRGVTYPGDAGPLVPGTRLIDDDGRDVGDVRSAAVSPRLGGVALGMIRREIAVGATLIARAPRSDAATDDATDDAAAPLAVDDRIVTVGSLPFPL